MLDIKKINVIKSNELRLKKNAKKNEQFKNRQHENEGKKHVKPREIYPPEFIKLWLEKYKKIVAAAAAANITVSNEQIRIHLNAKLGSNVQKASASRFINKATKGAKNEAKKRTA